MDVKCGKIGRCLVVTLSGEMDHPSASAARRQIDGAFHAEGAQHIIFDCHPLAFMDSAGLGLVMGRYRTAASLGGKVALACVSRQLDRIFTMAGIYRIVQKAPSVEAAVQLLEGGHA